MVEGKFHLLENTIFAKETRKNLFNIRNNPLNLCQFKISGILGRFEVRTDILRTSHESKLTKH